jgi:hypothetical protein
MTPSSTSLGSFRLGEEDGEDDVDDEVDFGLDAIEVDIFTKIVMII